MSLHRSAPLTWPRTLAFPLRSRLELGVLFPLAPQVDAEEGQHVFCTAALVLPVLNFHLSLA